MEQVDDIRILKASGRVSHESAARLGAALDAAIAESSGGLILDLEAVDYLSSAGGLVIEGAAARLAAVHRRFVLSGATEPVRVALDLAGLLPGLVLVPSRAEAIRQVARAS